MARNITALAGRVLGSDRGRLFDEAYYTQRFGPNPYNRNEGWLRFFNGMADEIVRSLQPKRVFDAGCAMGMLVESFWDRGVEAYGADLSGFAISNVRRDMQPYCRVASIADPLDDHFDLITCIEVLEHMPEDEAKQAIEQFSRAADAVLFSSTPSDFDEPTHINVHPIIYWLKLFGEFDFGPDLNYDAGFVCPHAILFRKVSRPVPVDVLSAFAHLLRLKATVVERDQRIHELNTFAAAHQDCDQTLRDALNRVASLEGTEKQLAEARGRIDSLEKSQTSLNHELDAARNASVAAGQALHAAEQAIEDERSRTADLQAASSREQADLEAAAADLEQRNIRLTQAAYDLNEEIRAIEQSLGWRFVLRYRKWFHAARARKSWVDRYFEPLAGRVLRRFAGRGDALVDRSIEHQPLLSPYAQWILRNEPTESDLDHQRKAASELAYRPKISVIVPVYKVAQPVLADTIQSVLDQTYDHWELCIVHADPAATATRTWLSTLAAREPRIKVEFLASNLGISGNSNKVLATSTGEFLALLDHDDTLAPFALFEVASQLNRDPKLDFIFSDKDQLSADGRERIEPLFKPSWSPDLMLSANYLTHLCVIRAETVRRIGGWRSHTDGAQDWDLFVRAIDGSNRIARIPKVLYHWRRVATSVASGMDAKPYAAAAQLAVVESYLDVRQWNAKPAFTASGLIQLRWNLKRRPTTTVILLSNDPQSAPFRDVELLQINTSGNSSALAERLNEAVKRSSGEFIIFLDQGVQPASETWIDEIVGPLSQPGIAIVGCKLLDQETCHLRHAGICFNSNGELAYPFASETEYIYNDFGAANWYRNWLAVSGACMGIGRDAFEAVGGFSAQPEFPRLDVDLCLKIAADSRRIFYNPFARIWQTKPAVIERWLDSNAPAAAAKIIQSKFPEGDPFFSPNLQSRGGRITLRMQADIPPSSTPINYEGQLVRRPGSTAEDGKVYMIRHGRKHWIMDHRWALQNGFRWPDDVKVISRRELNAIPAGEPFTYQQNQ